MGRFNTSAARRGVICGMVVSAATAGAAWAGARCDVAVADWRPREALQFKLEADGWQVRSIKVVDGCYEADAVDGQGRHVEAFFNPKTLEPVGVVAAGGNG